MISGLALALVFAAAEPAAVRPSVAADLDGDGSVETATAAPARGSVRLEVRDSNGRRLAAAKAPAPSGGVVPISLTSAPIGSAGALLELVAATDLSECRSVWRYRNARLERLPIREASGRALPDCAVPGEWASEWEIEGEGRPSAWVRERVVKVEAGELRRRETFAFAGFSLDFDPRRSRFEIDGIPIPSWYRATLYTRAGLERLYSRFDMAALEGEPTLTIETEPERGVFALRLSGPEADVTAPVVSLALSAGTATLSARAGEKTAHATIRLEGDALVPYEARVEGLGAPFDQLYSPAGSWRGGARQVFPSAADEIVSEYLAGTWGNERGENTSFAADGAPPYRLRMGASTYVVDMRDAFPADLLLLPVEPQGRAWGLALRGPNALDRVPYACEASSARPPCGPAGEPERLRRIGARVNVR